MSDNLSALSLEDFIVVLASKQSTPGGGAAAGLVGACGAALVSMVAHFTEGKPKFASDDELADVVAKSEVVYRALLDLVDADAKGFEPFSAAYALAKDDPARPQAIQDAYVTACGAPQDTIKQCLAALKLLDWMEAHCTKVMLADVVAGAHFARAAAETAAVMLKGNIAYIKDEAVRAQLSESYTPMLEECKKLEQSIAARGDTRLS